MDCTDVRQQILQGRGNRRVVRRHLRQCADCALFQQQIAEAEILLRTTLPFETPAPLQQRLQTLVPPAARELRARAAQQSEPASTRNAPSSRVLQVLLVLAIPLALSLGLSIWQQGLALASPWFGQVRELLPLIPDALVYWGGRLSRNLAPIREALLFICSFLLVGLALEQARRSQKRSSPTSAHR